MIENTYDTSVQYSLISVVLSKQVSYRYHNKRKSPINGLFTPFMKLCLLFKLGKSKGVLKYICLSFISFLPLFYFCCIYYFGSLIFCCQFVASFIITGADKFDNIQFENSAYLSLFYKIISTRIILTFIIRIIDIFFRIIQKCFFFNKSNI